MNSILRSLAGGLILLLLMLSSAWAEETYELDIANQKLSSALKTFAEQSGLQVVYFADLAAGKQAKGVHGTYSADQALSELLDDTDLIYSTVDDRTYSISRSAAAEDAGGDSDSGNGRTARVSTVLMAQAQTSMERNQESQRTETDSDEDEKKRPLEEIVVTGSHIRRSEFEGPSPVIVMTREDLLRSGRSTVAEVLAQLPQNNASPIATSTTRTVNLRGLGQDNTLVLVNGRRVSSSGFSASTSFVDLSTIPLAAVERIEVLPDGASALYGSDAVAGVVNIILKKDFVGSEISFNGGFSLEGGAREIETSFVTGWSKGGFNALLSSSYFNRNKLSAADRSFSETDDLRSRGGRDLRNQIANPGNVFSLDGENLPGLDTPFAGIPAGQDGRDLTPADFEATAGQLNLQSLVADFSDLIFDTERYGLNARLDGALSSWLTVFAEAGIGHNENIFVSSPPRLVAMVPETNPFNPFGEPVQVRWLATELTPTRKNEVDNQRVVAGLEGRLWESWAWETSFGYSRDEVSSRGRFGVFGPIDELLSRSDPATALNVFGDGAGVNSPEVLSELGLGFIVTDAVSDLLTVAGKADGPVLEFAGREVRTALGWEYRDESFELSFFAGDPQAPLVAEDVVGDRQITAGFFELNLPLFGPEHDLPGLRALDLQVATRVERYSDFGNTVNPKLALHWQPIESLAVRGSMGTGFRAPTLSQLFNVSIPFDGAVIDPRRNDESVLVEILTGGNLDLEPEESRSWNVGFVWDVPFLRGLSLTTDLWGLRQTERITALSSDELLAAEAFFPDRVTRAEPTEEDIEAGRPGRLLALDRTNLNASEARVRGLDFGLRYSTDSAVGRFDLRANGAFIYRFDRQLTPVAPVEELEGVLSGSTSGEGSDHAETRFRAKLSQFWSRGAWEVGVTERYTGESRDLRSTFHPVISNHVEVDVQVNYTWPRDTGLLAGTRLSLGAVNVFNNKPPFRDNFRGFASALHDPRQAFYQLRLTKAF